MSPVKPSPRDPWDDLPANGPGDKSRRAARTGPVLLYADAGEARAITGGQIADSRITSRETMPVSKHRPPRGLLVHRADLPMPASLLGLDWLAAEQWARVRETDPGWAPDEIPMPPGPGRG